MYTLYYAPGSANMLVHLTLLECGAAYLALNLNGVVPTQVDRMGLNA